MSQILIRITVGKRDEDNAATSPDQKGNEKLFIVFFDGWEEGGACGVIQ